MDITQLIERHVIMQIMSEFPEGPGINAYALVMDNNSNESLPDGFIVAEMYELLLPQDIKTVLADEFSTAMKFAEEIITIHETNSENDQEPE